MHYYLNGAGLESELAYKSAWEIGRIQTYYTYLPYADSKKSTPSIQKFLPLTWDVESKSERFEPISVEELKIMEQAWQVSRQ